MFKIKYLPNINLIKYNSCSMYLFFFIVTIVLFSQTIVAAPKEWEREINVKGIANHPAEAEFKFQNNNWGSDKQEVTVIQNHDRKNFANLEKTVSIRSNVNLDLSLRGQFPDGRMKFVNNNGNDTPDKGCNPPDSKNCRFVVFKWVKNGSVATLITSNNEIEGHTPSNSGSGGTRPPISSQSFIDHKIQIEFIDGYTNTLDAGIYELQTNGVKLQFKERI